MQYTENQILSELTRQYEQEGLRVYKPNEKQLLFHKSQAQERGLVGPNKSGKSFGGAMEMAWTVGRCHPYRPNIKHIPRGRDCCVTFKLIKNTLVPLYQSLLPRKRCNLDYKTFEGKQAVWPGLKGGSWRTAWSEQDKRITLEDESFIEFMSYEQGREAFQGSVIDIIRHDEEPPGDIYGENMARQVTVQRNLLFTLTPLNYSQWLYNKLYEQSLTDPNVEIFVMDRYDNKHVNQSVYDAMEESISDPAEVAARVYGTPVVMSGRVYKDYGEHNYVDYFKPPWEWAKSCVIDPHPEKPTAVLWIAEDFRGRLFAYREALLKGDVEQICNEIRALSSGDDGLNLWLIDPSSRQRAGIRGKGRLIDEFRTFLPYGIIEANNDVDAGIDIVRRMTKNTAQGPQLFVMHSCPLTHHQMKSYMWKPPTASGEDRTKPQVYKKDDDLPDCYRYRAMYGRQTEHTEFSGFGIRGYAN